VKIVVAGGTGWLGAALCRALATDGHAVVVLARSGGSRPVAGERLVPWDGRGVGGWAEEIADADAVVNLSGAPIAPQRWTPARKRLLRSSRLEPTKALIAAMERAARRPKVLINTSAVGYYGDRGDELAAEDDPPGSDFLATLAADWEAAARPATELGVRVVLPRLGVVIGRGGEALRYLALPVRLFLGGHLGSGRQWVSWIHLDDVVGIYRLALEHGEVSGPLNVTAPQPVSNRDLAQALGRVLGRPIWAPVPGWAMRLVLGELADTLLFGQRAMPATLQRLGYAFHEPALLPALHHALR